MPDAAPPKPDPGAHLRAAGARWWRWWRGRGGHPSLWFGTSASGLLSEKTLRRWLPLAALIGLLTGLAAIALALAIRVSTSLFLGRLIGYLPPDSAGEGTNGVVAMARPWALPLVLALGGLLCGLVVRWFAPDASGHGTDTAIEAFHQDRALDGRIPAVKILATAITIGSGGSGAPEGPMALIGAAFGSILGRHLKLDAHDRRIAVAAGIGAGIAAIFRAPLGGAVLAAEILYTGDLEPEVIIPALVASVISYTTFSIWAGWTPLFGDQAAFQFEQPLQLLYFAALGLGSGLVGILYARTFRWLESVTKRVAVPREMKPALGGLLVGLIGLVLPQTLGMGYGWLQVAMDPRLLAIPLWALVLLPFAKILATSLTIGSGGSAGTFGPGLVIGGLLGALLWRLTAGLFPDMPLTAAPFVIVAMMAVFGSISHVPVAVMLMVGEMTGNLSLLAPAMIAVGIATWVVGHDTLFPSQRPTRADSPAHRMELSFPLLGSMSVAEAMGQPPRPLHPRDLLADAELVLDSLANGTHSAAVVQDGRLVGVIARGDIARAAAHELAVVLVEQVMTTDPVCAGREDTLDLALERLASRHLPWLPVIDAPDSRRLVGQIDAQDIMRAYRSRMGQGLRGMRGVLRETAPLHDEPLGG
ncbi:MAG: chloride channel protein [Chloroflexota bacterium]